MKFMKFLALAAVISLAGCDSKLDIVNGEIPANFLGHVQSLLGQWNGQFDRKAVTVSLALEGNRLVWNTNNDMISPACRSRVGNLKKVSYKEKDGKVEITGAEFFFDANLCLPRPAGDTIYVDFEGGTTMQVSLRDYTDVRTICGNPPYYPYPPRSVAAVTDTVSHHGYPHDPYYPHPGYGCRTEYFDYYLTGRFQKN